MLKCRPTRVIPITGILMRQQGRITRWDDDKGFGFITRNGEGPIVFVHVKAFANRQRRPTGNELVSYEVGTDAQGRSRACNVAFVGEPRGQPRLSAPSNIALVIATLFVVAIGWLVVVGKLPFAVLAIQIAASVVSFFAYALDKAAARTNRWRTQETTLHLFALLGGWPGAAAAQRLLRHKNRKRSFLVVFWLTVIVNCAALAWLLSPYGTDVLQAILASSQRLQR